MRIIKTSNFSKQASEVWYHGTTFSLSQKIKQMGFLSPGMPTKYDRDIPREDAVYITKNISTAKYYSIGQQKGVVLQVRVDDLSKLVPDEDDVWEILGSNAQDAISLRVKNHWMDYNTIENTDYYRDFPEHAPKGFEDAWRSHFDHAEESDIEGGSFASTETKYFVDYLCQNDPQLAKQIISKSGNAAYLGRLPVVGEVKTASVNEDAMLDMLQEKTKTTGPEKKTILPNDVVLFTDPFGSYRFVKYFQGQAVSAVQIMKRPTGKPVVANLFTKKEFRRQRFASEVMEAAKGYFGNIQHSKDLSQDAEGFLKSRKESKTKIASPPPPPEMVSKPLYHGTDNESAGQGILQKGSLTPPVTGRKGLTAPVAGKVYMSPDLSYALIYAIGGDMAGHKLFPNWIERHGRYGYVFQVDGSDLKDVQPDEDSVGEMLYNKKGPWWLANLAQRIVAPSRLKKVMDGEYAYWASVGKQLLNRMSESEKQQLLPHGGHVAHTGDIRISAAWKVDKMKCEQFSKDGSNFFEIAEKVF